MTDKELISGILTGNQHTLSVFYHIYEPKLRRQIFCKVNDIHDGEEILQDTLFAFLEAVRDFTGNSSLSTFLYSICSHKIIDYYRKKKLRYVVFSRIPMLEHLLSPLSRPDETADTALVVEHIRSVLYRLLPVYREVLLYKYVDNLTVMEIAGRLAVSGKSAENKLFRARKAFITAYKRRSTVHNG